MKYLIVSVLWFRFENFSYTVLRESYITVKTVLNWLLSLITTTCYIQNFNKMCCINVVAKVVDLSFSIGTTTTKVVKSHMRLRKYWILLLSTIFSGHHKSSQKLVNGELLGHETINSELQHHYFNLTQQCGHTFSYRLMSLRIHDQ